METSNPGGFMTKLYPVLNEKLTQHFTHTADDKQGENTSHIILGGEYYPNTTSRKKKENCFFVT